MHVSGIYELPVGRGKRFLHDSSRAVNAVLGGWVTNWILTLQDGQPGTIPCATARLRASVASPIKVAGQNPYAGPHNVNQWLNPAAFATPPVATTWADRLQPARRRPGPISLGPGFHRLDFSLFKVFQLTERFRLEFRSEFFNLTNHPNFTNPGFGGNGVTAAPGSLDYLSNSFGRYVDARRAERPARNTICT